MHFHIHRGILCLFAGISFASVIAEPTTQPEAENLIVNGGFETPAADDRHLALSHDELTGWTIERGDVDVVSTYWPAQEGKQSLDLNGFTRGVISQSIDTQLDQWYQLTFYYSGNPDENAADKIRAAEVQWGNKRLVTLRPELGTLEDMKWQKAEYVVKATAKKTDLLFISVTDGKYGVALDNVSLTACDAPTTQPAAVETGK